MPSPSKASHWVEQSSAYFASGATRSLAFRRAQLSKLGALIETHDDLWARALAADLGKPVMEMRFSEVGFVLNDIQYATKHLSSWMQPRKRRTPPGLLPGSSRVLAEPRGVVLVLSPWNYPLQLLFSPLISAMAAGNVCCVKPSEYAPAVSAAVAHVMKQSFDPRYLTVMEGGPETAMALLDERFDAVFFTGSLSVGRKVMAAASRHPTPVTLELGGKSPCIVCADTDITVAARRIAWGKFMNAGQTCVAPDYVLVERPVQNALVKALVDAIRQFFGPDPRNSRDYGRIVNHKHLQRLQAMMKDRLPVIGGEVDPVDGFLAPTLFCDPPLDSLLMQDEIFGPLLPVIGVDTLSEAISIIQSKPSPLALYLFTDCRQNRETVLQHTRSGGVCINDTILQLLNRHLPFGGLGASGFGASHGQAGFDTFTHYRPVVTRSIWPDIALRYPPCKASASTLKRLNRWLFV